MEAEALSAGIVGAYNAAAYEGTTDRYVVETTARAAGRPHAGVLRCRLMGPGSGGDDPALSARPGISGPDAPAR